MKVETKLQLKIIIDASPEMLYFRVLCERRKNWPKMPNWSVQLHPRHIYLQLRRLFRNQALFQLY